MLIDHTAPETTILDGVVRNTESIQEMEVCYDGIWYKVTALVDSVPSIIDSILDLRPELRDTLKDYIVEV